MQQPGIFNLALYRGDTATWRVVLYADAAGTIPVDLTGVVAAAEIRDKSAGNVVVELTCVVTLPNLIDVGITPAMWTGAPRSGVWDLQLTYPDSTVRTVLAGAVAVTPDVTDSALLAPPLVLT